jgi:hypothetical protein
MQIAHVKIRTAELERPKLLGLMQERCHLDLIAPGWERTSVIVTIEDEAPFGIRILRVHEVETVISANPVEVSSRIRFDISW